jgi:tRNA1(Val) A37 N6-methylase TrmN6
MAEPVGEIGEIETSQDALLGGRLAIRQPTAGHRVGSDAILLAAAAPADGVERLVDVGAGIGAVGLSILQRSPEASADLVEADAGLAQFARENAALNSLQDRVRMWSVDVFDARARRAAGLADGGADLVVTNPPFFEAQAVRASPDARRAKAHVFAPAAPGEADRGPLEAWIVASLALLRPGGRFILIHRPEALALILRSFGRRVGAVAILPVHPRAETAAHRILVAGVKGARAPTRILPGLILHATSGAFTPLAEAIHRGEALIDWGGERR